MEKDPEENHAGNQITWIPPGSFVLYGHAAWEHGCYLELPQKSFLQSARPTLRYICPYSDAVARIFLLDQHFSGSG